MAKEKEQPTTIRVKDQYVYVLGTESNMQMQTYIGRYHPEDPSDLIGIRELEHRILKSPFVKNLLNREASFRGREFAQAGLSLSGMYLSSDEYDRLVEAADLLPDVVRFKQLLGD